MTKKYTIINDDQNVNLEGDLLGEVSSYSAEKNNWTEYRIYKTKNDKYVVEIKGKTKISTQKEKTNILETFEPSGVIQALKRPGRDSNLYLTNLAKDVIKEAAKNDEGLHDAYYNLDIT